MLLVPLADAAHRSHQVELGRQPELAQEPPRLHAEVQAQRARTVHAQCTHAARALHARATHCACTARLCAVAAVHDVLVAHVAARVRREVRVLTEAAEQPRRAAGRAVAGVHRLCQREQRISRVAVRREDGVEGAWSVRASKVRGAHVRGRTACVPRARRVRTTVACVPGCACRVE